MTTVEQPDSKESPKLGAKLLAVLPTSPFARSFTEAALAGLIVIALIGGWLTFRSDRTAEMLQAQIPVKATPIEASNAVSPNIAVGDRQGEGETSGPVATPLPPAPITGLTEPYEQGFLPIARAEDELTPFEAYRKPFVPQSGKSLVSIVVVDYGLSAAISQSLLEAMPEDISLVLNPYSNDVAAWGTKAREAGHEFWLSMPMEAQNAIAQDTGPLTIMINASLEENRSRLFKLMSSATGYAGLVSQDNHAFIKTDMDVSPIMKQVFGRGLAFAESNPAIPAYGLSMAMEFAYPYVQNTYWIDASLRPADIDRALKMIERQAQSKGRVVAFVHPYPVAIRKIQEWAKTAEDNNIQLAPLSAMVQ